MRSKLAKELKIPAGDNVLFAGDMHLEKPHSAQARQLLKLLEEGGSPERHLVLVGDVLYFYFENNFGIVRKFRWLTDALSKAAQHWGSVVFLHGNRDYLAGEGGHFPKDIHLAGDYLILETSEKRILVTHGDLFLKNNPGYFRFRRFMRSPLVRWSTRNLPPAMCRFAAHMLRWISFRNNKDKCYEPPDRDKMAEALSDHEADALVFGHFHRKMSPEDFPDVNLKAWCVGSWEQERCPMLKYEQGEFVFTDAISELEQDK
ncbi:MAG: UDP-2,3-diacylglucosamine diphosphatase [Planctomycetota bacterium]|nr:UDP-2,3-diacylglucosamine diphosphatase [Planctomycetota bacterium]